VKVGKFLAAEWGLAYDLYGQSDSFFSGQVILAFLLGKALCRAVIRPDTGRFPSTIIP